MTDEQGHLVGLFWCDTQCLLDYAAFGVVVVYNLPLVPFVGVNHHKRTVLFGCGIISHENKNSYEWLLRIFSNTNIQKHHISVITDGDLAMQRAIRIVWPNSSHRLCGWHFEQNLMRNVHNDKLKEAFRVFMYDCCSIQEIDRK
jgi:zinc finger SWIM domain-containing protein 3